MRFAFRSPRIFRHGGLYLQVWYRVFRIGEH